jgi:hypothetical protein
MGFNKPSHDLEGSSSDQEFLLRAPEKRLARSGWFTSRERIIILVTFAIALLVSLSAMNLYIFFNLRAMNSSPVTVNSSKHPISLQLIQTLMRLNRYFAEWPSNYPDNPRTD